MPYQIYGQIIFTYLKPYRFLFGIGWIFLLLSSSAMILFPYLMGQLLGSSGNKVTSMNDSLSLISLGNVNSVVIMLFVLFGIQAVFSYFRVVIFTNVTENALRDLRRSAFEKLIFMPMDFFNQNKVGELTSRISSDITQIQETLRIFPSNCYCCGINNFVGFNFLEISINNGRNSTRNGNCCCFLWSIHKKTI